jgi:hypothetical protein
MMLLSISFLCITCGTYAVSILPTPEDKPTMAKLCSDYMLRQQEQNTQNGPIRSRLNKDPEQQEEHAHDAYTDLIVQLHSIEKELPHTNCPEKLQQFERACRFIMTALLCAHAKENKDALVQIDNCIRIAAMAQLLQNSSWHTLIREFEARKNASSPSTYPIDAVESHLQVDETRKDRLIKELLKQLEARNANEINVSKPAEDELITKLTPYKKKKKEIVSSIAKIEQLMLGFRTGGQKKAAKHYNGAFISELSADANFLQSKDAHDYLLFEQTYGAVALLYIQAHDYGHPTALAAAERIMKSGIMRTIITWKAKHHIKNHLQHYGKIWHEINRRKMKLSEIGDLSASSSTDSSSSASSSSST